MRPKTERKYVQRGVRRFPTYVYRLRHSGMAPTPDLAWSLEEAKRLAEAVGNCEVIRYEMTKKRQLINETQMEAR